MRRNRRDKTVWPWVVAALVLSAPGCGVEGAESGQPPAADEPLDCPDPDEEATPPEGFMSPTRVLRRMTVSLRGDFPTRDEYEELVATPDEQKDAWLDAKLDELLAQPTFYDRMFEFARLWVNLPPHMLGGMNVNYAQTQFKFLRPCPPGTLHAGAYRNYWGGGDSACEGIRVGSDPPEPALVTTAEPWWAPGTTVTVVGRMANTAAYDVLPNGDPIDCGYQGDGARNDFYETCGCGPNFQYCTNQPRGTAANIDDPSSYNRLIWEEPARLFAHIAWHDRPATDWLLGTYSVGPRALQAVYVRHGRQAVSNDPAAAEALDARQDWWRADQWASPADPYHAPTDPAAWSEFEVHTRHPLLVADRHVAFDPRVEPPSSLPGIPSAGMLTSLGVTTNWPRERVRGARLIEILACENLTPPPADQEFNHYTRDPGSEGSCQHCHSRIDPASIHFKRFIRAGNKYPILGLGAWQFPPSWREGRYPYSADPWPRMARLWDYDMRMTPVSQARVESEPDSTWIDFLPPDQALYGEVSDGTVGPLGFGKLVVASGAFERCLVRRLHEAIVGRDINPQTEAGYLESLVEVLVGNGFEIRPVVRAMVRSDVFRRGL